eukprot:symbB.v1.2.009907.t2/scaffold605.1/size182108/7
MQRFVKPSAADSTGVHGRLAATLLTLLDGIDAGRSSMGLAICATSRRAAKELDARLTRPGRMDRWLQVTAPDEEERWELLQHFVSLEGGACDACSEGQKLQILQGTKHFQPQDLRTLIRGAGGGKYHVWSAGGEDCCGGCDICLGSLGVGHRCTGRRRPVRRNDRQSCKVERFTRPRALRLLVPWQRWFRAGHFSVQQKNVFRARIWDAWLALTIHGLDVAHQRISHGVARRKGFLLQAAISWWVQAIEKIRDFQVLVPVLVDSLSEAYLAHGQRQTWRAWRRWWHMVEEGRRADDEELLYVCFRSWWNGSVEQHHKRRVHLLCERYRDVRMKRKTLFAWKSRLERLSMVMGSVEFWAASSYSKIAWKALSAWHDTCQRRQRAREGQQKILQQRRSALLNSWHLLMLRRITALGVAEAVLQGRALRWLRAWKSWAFAHARRRESDEVKTAIVKQSRQRWGMERWCSAGRFQRLVDVAEKWDGQVLCRQLVVRAFTGWSAMMGLYACGEKVAAAVGARRACRLLRHWSFLLHVGTKRPHQLMRQIMARWRLFLQRCSDVQRGLERLGRWTMGPTFRRFVAYVRDRKQRRQDVSSHSSHLQTSGRRRAQASALAWWRRSVGEDLQTHNIQTFNKSISFMQPMLSSSHVAVPVGPLLPRGDPSFGRRGFHLGQNGHWGVNGVTVLLLQCVRLWRRSKGSQCRVSRSAVVDPLTVGRVCEVVEEYGQAWVKQDPARIAALFSIDAVYIERIFDTRSTYRGREAIQQYWETQILGKQSNIEFRHIASDMILDPKKHKVMVKWLAEFDNIRYCVPEKEKRVRFVQVAILEFSEDAKELTLLEEYMQSVHGEHFRWPFSLQVPESHLHAMRRMDPGAFASQPRSCECASCGRNFDSRNALFRHMRRNGGVNDCVPKAVPAVQLPPSERFRESRQHVALLLSYSQRPDGWEERLMEASQVAFQRLDGEPPLALRLSWAVPTSRAPRAAGNVLGLRLPREAENIEEEVILDKLSRHLNIDGTLLQCRKVPCSFHATRCCELERFEALLPWSVLTSNTTVQESCSTRGVSFDRALARRVKNGLQQLRMGQHWQNFCERSTSRGDPPSFFLNRLVATVERPGWCLIRCSVQQSLPQMIPRLLGALVLWCRGFVPDNFLEEAVAEGSRMSIPAAPETCFYLLAPHMARFEHKNQLTLTFGFAELQSQHLQSFRDEIIAKEMATGALQQWSDDLASPSQCFAGCSGTSFRRATWPYSGGGRAKARSSSIASPAWGFGPVA